MYFHDENSKLEIDRKYLNIIKAIYEKLTANIPVGSGHHFGCSLSLCTSPAGPVFDSPSYLTFPS